MINLSEKKCVWLLKALYVMRNPEAGENLTIGYEEVIRTLGDKVSNEYTQVQFKKVSRKMRKSRLLG